MFIYILENATHKLYIGQIKDITLRLARHNNASGRLWTNKNGPWRLIYSKEFSTRSEAINYEKKLKSLKVGQRIKEILNIQ